MSTFSIRPDPWVRGQPDTDWLREHGDDEIGVKLIDLLSLVARLEETQQDPCSAVTAMRLFTCDLPRIRAYLPARALEEL